MSLLRRSTMLLGAIAALAAVSPAYAPAKHGGGYRSFDAAEAGSSVITSAGPGRFSSTGEAAIQGRLIGKGKLQLDLAIVVREDGKWTVGGPFTITAANGDTLTGISWATIGLAGQVNPVVFYSRVLGGTGRFARARGRLVSRGTTTISSVDPATGAVHTKDEATCKGRIWFGKRHIRGARH